MKIIHVASFDRWTGAAAPAFSEVEALREAGYDAHYAYVGGGKLEKKLDGLAFAHPVIRREADPGTILRTARMLRAMVDREGFTIVHTHLTHDHWLGRLATLGRSPAALVRTFHSKRTLRRDPVTRWLLSGTRGVCVINATFLGHGALRKRDPLFTPPPVDARVLRPGPGVRERYGIPPGRPLLGFIGKVDRGRGFEDAIRTLEIVRRSIPETMLLMIGHGPLRPALEKLASAAGVGDAVVWAGYQEDDLAEHLRTPDLLLFTAPGSDEGHRAIVEAMACGTPVVSYPIDGVRELLGPLASRLVSASAEPHWLAATAVSVLNGEVAIPEGDCLAAVEASRYGPTASRLARLYAMLTPRADFTREP